MGGGGGGWLAGLCLDFSGENNAENEHAAIDIFCQVISQTDL